MTSFFVPPESDGQIRPRLSVRESEQTAYRHLSDSAVGHQSPVQPRAMGGGGLRRVSKSGTFWVVAAFLVAYAMCVWTINVAERLAKLAS